MGETSSSRGEPQLRVAAVLEDRGQAEQLTALLDGDHDLEHFLAHLLSPLSSSEQSRFVRLVLAREGAPSDRVLATLDQLAGVEHQMIDRAP